MKIHLIKKLKMIRMETLKYTIIKDSQQYSQYCNILENLISEGFEPNKDEIDLLTLLIEKWDSENTAFNDKDPVELLKSLMLEHNLKAKDMSEILVLSKGTISKILNYHKGLSKDTIRRLSGYFKLSQEAFNRPYRLINEINRPFRNSRLMKTIKNRVEAV
jgi:HTH-type transcriptional regulator/antitoxin HigA